jgi:hypothetical protein
MAKAFWIDQEFDRDRDGRYAVHVRKNLEEFEWGDIAPVRFACAAWRLATPPALTPGYVRWDRRILEATCHRNTWDGTLYARIRVVSPLPEGPARRCRAACPPRGDGARPRAERLGVPRPRSARRLTDQHV